MRKQTPLLFFLFFLFGNAGTAFSQTAAELIRLCDAIYASNPDSSFVLSRRAELLAAETNDTASLCRALARNARYLVLKSRFEETNEAVNKSIRFSEAIGDNKNLAYAIKLKAILLKRIGNPTEGIMLEEKAAMLYGSVGDTTGKCNVWLNLSLDYIESGDYVKGQATLDSIAQYPSMLETSIGYYYHQNSGKLFTAKKEYAAALKEYELIRPFAIEHKMLDSYVTLLSLIAEAQMKSGDLNAAEKSLMESCKMARENHLNNELDESLVLLTQVYTSKGDYQKAFETLKEQSELNRSIYNLERINKINELEKRLQLAEKEKQLSQKDFDLEKEKIETDRLSTQNILLYFIVGAVLVVSILIAVLLLCTRMLNTRIEGQNKLIQEKSAIIEDAYKNITDSISYSKRIQNAILPDDALIHSIFPESFVLYKPKDIVSGDFYWFERWGNEILFAAVDCTGHGVPGAFMSIVGHNQLNEAVNVHGLSKPNLILNALNKGVSKTLRQTDSEEEGLLSLTQVKDGMDIALCAFNPATRLLQFAGAYNPLWIIRKNELIEMSPDKQPIGAYPGQELKLFTAKEIQLEAGDCLYLFTDGYADQFGGPRGKKFKYAQFKQVLLDHVHLPMEKQKIILDQTIENWRGSFEQIDDILVMGIRV